MKLHLYFYLILVVTCCSAPVSISAQYATDSLSAQQYLDKHRVVFQQETRQLWVQEKSPNFTSIQFRTAINPEDPDSIFIAKDKTFLLVQKNKSNDRYTLAAIQSKSKFDRWIKAHFPHLILSKKAEKLKDKYDNFIDDANAWSSDLIRNNINHHLDSAKINGEAIPWTKMNLRDFLTTAIVLTLQQNDNRISINDGTFVALGFSPLPLQDKNYSLLSYNPQSTLAIEKPVQPTGYNFPDWLFYLMIGLLAFSIIGLLWFYYSYKAPFVAAFKETIEILQTGKENTEKKNLENPETALYVLRDFIKKHQNKSLKKEETTAKKITPSPKTTLSTSQQNILDKVDTFTQLNKTDLHLSHIKNLLSGIGAKPFVLALLDKKTSDKKATESTAQINKLIQELNLVKVQEESILAFFKTKDAKTLIQQLEKINREKVFSDLANPLEDLSNSHQQLKRILYFAQEDQATVFIKQLEEILTKSNPTVASGLSFLQLFNFRKDAFIEDLDQRYQLAIELEKQANRISIDQGQALDFIQSIQESLALVEQLNPSLGEAKLAQKTETQLVDYLLLQQLVEREKMPDFWEQTLQQADTLHAVSLSFSPLKENATLNWVKDKMVAQVNRKNQDQFFVHFYNRYRDFTHDLASKSATQPENLAWFGQHLIEMFFSTIDFLANEKASGAPLSVRLYAGANYQSILNNNNLMDNLKNWKASQELKGEADAFLANLIDFARHLHVKNLDRILIHGYHIPEEVLKTGNGTVTRYAKTL